ncbi:YeiH family protein [Sinomicrobium sp. M5D2P9]
MRRALQNEDTWSIIIGLFLILTGLMVFFISPYPEIKQENSSFQEALEQQKSFPYKTVEWYRLSEEISASSSAETPAGKAVHKLLQTPGKWEYNPVRSLYKDQALAKTTIAAAEDSLSLLEKEALALHRQFIRQGESGSQAAHNAGEAAATWYEASKAWDKVQKSNSSYNLMGTIPALALVLGLLFSVGGYFMGYGFRSFFIAFLGVFALALISFILGKQEDVSSMGFGYPLWGIVLGMLISNTVGTPSWLLPAVKTEFYIKTGLVLLGAEILFSKVLSIGLPGIFVAWVVTPLVLVLTYWFGQKVLKMASKSLNITISADMSVCGVSAAIAAAAASKASKEELTLAVGLSMVFTSVMMVLLPAFINMAGMPEVLGGAWIGGTIDATGAVVAAGAFLGETALQVAATIKMIQNMLIGLIAFFVAYYFARKSEDTPKTKGTANELWLRFPKFILGFVGASVLISLLYHWSGTTLGEALIDRGLIRGFTKNIRSWLFCLAFVSIGLSVNFKELRSHFSGGKPLILYACGQLFNLLLTLGMAYLMFYIVFPEITESL